MSRLRLRSPIAIVHRRCRRTIGKTLRDRGHRHQTPWTCRRGLGRGRRSALLALLSLLISGRHRARRRQGRRSAPSPASIRCCAATSRYRCFRPARVSFDDVSLGDNRTGAPALTAEQLVVRLRFFPLLIGRIEIADVSLVRPTITIDFAPDGTLELVEPCRDAGARAASRARARCVSFSEIRIADGTVILRDEAHKIVETLDRRRIRAGLAVDLEELRGDRPLRLARRADRRDARASPISWPR